MSGVSGPARTGSAPTAGARSGSRPAPGLVKSAKRLALRSLHGAENLAASSRARLKAAARARLQATAARDPAEALAMVARARRLFGQRRFLAEAEALLTARARGWAAAAPLIARIAADGEALTGPGAAALLRAPGPAPATDLARPARDRPHDLPTDAAARIVVYTARFGTRPVLPPLFALTDRLRFLCFTDHPVEVPGWECLPSAQPDLDGAAAEAFHRIRADTVLAEAAPAAEFSLWIAPDRVLLGNLDTLITRWLIGRDLVLWRHGRGADWHDLVEAALVTGEVLAGESVAGAAESAAGAMAPGLLDQAAACDAAGMPRETLVCDSGLLWRRHGAEDVAALMAAWWALREARPADQAGDPDLDLARALAAPGAARPQVLPAALGPATDNPYVARQPRQGRARPRPAPTAGAGRPLPVRFLFAEKYARSASALLRGEQLSAMIGAAFPDRYDVAYVGEIEAVRDAVVIVTKGALKVHHPEALARLRARNVLCIGAWDDALPDPAKVAQLDAQMTLAHRQMLDLNRIYPRVPAYHVTHHVNAQVNPCQPPEDRLRTGYLGVLENTVLPATLGHAVELVGIDTANVNHSWLDALPRFNCHWIVRQTRVWDGWKPFLKGFVAARCNAVVIVTCEDGDTAHYLGDDYPFYAASTEASDLEMAWAEAAAAFGGPDWARARAIMDQVRARNSEAQVCAEFAAMLDDLLG
jgi:hypothetical protein